MELTYSNQVKLALTQYHAHNSSPNVDDKNYFDNYKSKCASLNFLPSLVDLVRQHIKKSNNYTLRDDSSNYAITNSISDTTPMHSQHLRQQQPATSTPLVKKLNDMQQKVFNIFWSFLDSMEENDNTAP